MKINIEKFILNNKDDFIFNVLNIDNFNKESSGLRNYYQNIIKNHKKLPGNLLEFGVFKGRSLLATALLLKKLKSKKIVYGFDSFQGFPSYHEYDKLKYLKRFKKVYNLIFHNTICSSIKKTSFF